ncbi:Uncharacterised protein [Vibrio cholerae]|nr:Uncharacterised protein [Vibrio cholerae]CSI43476.1 Uncharacterised protein [Vibrio cholerae]
MRYKDIPMPFALVIAQKIDETLGCREFYRFNGTYYLSICQLQPLMWFPRRILSNQSKLIQQGLQLL